MNLHRRLLQICVILFPVLIVLLAVIGSANLLAADSLSYAEKSALRSAGAVVLMVAITDLTLLVGLVAWQLAEPERRSDSSDRSSEE